MPQRSSVVSAAIAEFHELLLGGHAETTRANLERALERHAVYAYEPPREHILRPLFIDRDTYGRTMTAATDLNRALVHIVERLVHDKSLRSRVGIPAYLDPLLEIDRDHGRPTVIGRFDGMADDSGAFKVIEFNSEPRGIPARVEIDLAFMSAPIAAAFSRRFRFCNIPLFDRCLEAIYVDHERTGDRGAPCIVLLCDETGRILQDHNRYLAYAASRGCRVATARASELDYRDGVLSLGGVRVDRIVLSSWLPLLAGSDEVADVVRALREGAVRVLHGVARGLLASYKHTFELLSDAEHRDLFPADTVPALVDHVPWTRVVYDRSVSYRGRDVELLRLITDHRERFALKPSGGSAGEGVVLGWACDRDRWDRAVQSAALQKNHIVQERVFGVEEEFAHISARGCEIGRFASDLLPFVWNGEHASGCMARVGATAGPVNVASGACAAPVWIIDGRA